MKKYIVILLILVLGITIVGCSQSEEPEVIREEENVTANDNENKAGEENNIEKTKEENDSSPDNTEREVTLYFINEEYIITGDESLEKIIPQKVTIEREDIPLEEAIVRKLMESPDSDGLSTSIPETVELLEVEVSDGTAFVNFAQEGLYGGSLQESFTITQIVNSLLELDNVDRVQFLVDGAKTESLMGHLIILDPFDEAFN